MSESVLVTKAVFEHLVAQLGEQGRDDIEWAESLREPSSADDFAEEVIFVICNSGMQHKVARGIYDRCIRALAAGTPVADVFGHKGKSAAIEKVWREREQLLAAYLAAEDKLQNLRGLPWIGSITCFHLAKNFGADVAKPDVHLVRLADREGVSAQALCERLARETGYRVATVDTVLWRACALGALNSRTGDVPSLKVA